MTASVQTVTESRTEHEYRVTFPATNEALYVDAIVWQQLDSDLFGFEIRCLGAKRHVEVGYESRVAAGAAAEAWVERCDWESVS